MDKSLSTRTVEATEAGYSSVLDLMASLWDETCEDGAKFDDYMPSPEDLWVEFHDGDLVIGAIRLRQFNGVTLHMCVNIRKEHRKDYADLVAYALHEWIPENCPRFHKVVAFIPSCFKNVIGFAQRSGWHGEGIMQDAFQKDGNLHNIHIFGKKIIEMRAQWAQP